MPPQKSTLFSPHRIRLGLIVLAITILSACRPTETPVPSPAPPTEVAGQTATPTAQLTATPQPTATTTPQPLPTDLPTSTITPTNTPPPQTAVLEPAECQFETPPRQQVECGYLIVPASRKQPDGSTIRLHVAIFKSLNPHPQPDPLVYLEGGPGGNPLEAISLVFSRRFASLVENRDLVIFDQRGSGLSEPALDCPEIIAYEDEIRAERLSATEKGQGTLQATQACHKRLLAEGVNLRIFNSAESAADLNDLRLALGYDSWNLYGVSYGTRLALTATRDHPDGVRSLILDSAYPLESDLYVEAPANADRALTTLFAGCASDPSCAEAFPDLETVFFQTVARLEQNPSMISITNPLTGQSFDMLVEGTDLVEFVFTALYVTELIPLLPQLILDISQDKFDTFALLEGSFLVDLEYVSRGMHYAVQCHEEAPFSDPAAVSAAIAAYPRVEALYQDGFAGQSIFAVCQDWGAGRPAEVENRAVQSDIPALIIAGQYDPITPPHWGEQIAANLSNSFFYTFPAAGHGAGFADECARTVVQTFLTDPHSSPDADCLTERESPAFQVPLTDITLQPFSNDLFGISGLLPEGWPEIGPGVYGSANRAIIQQAGPPGIDSYGLLEFIARSLELDDIPDPISYRETDRFTWSLYELEILGSPIDLAVTDDGRQAYIIMLQAGSSDREFLYQHLFLPAIDALAPLAE